MASSVVGLDIGGSVLLAVEVSDPTSARPTLVRYHQIELPAGAVTSGEVLEPNTVAAALKHLWTTGGFKSRNVVLGVGNQRVLARDLSVPKMSLARIRESLPFEVQEMLPIPVADALLDFYPISESEGPNGPMVNGLLIAAVKAAVLANVKATHLAGLKTIDVDLIPFALSRVMVTRQGMTGTVALVDIGGSTTSVVIAADGVPQFVRLIATGGDDITQALLSELKSDAVHAEQTKLRLGLATGTVPESDKRSVEIIYKVASEQLTSLRNTINYFVNTRPTSPVSQVVLSGGGGQLRGLPEALAEMTRIPVIVGDPFATVGIARGLDAEELRLHGTTFAVALGLALGSAA